MLDKSIEQQGSKNILDSSAKQKLNFLFVRLLESKEWEQQNFRKFLFDNVYFIKLWWGFLEEANRQNFKLLVSKGLIDLGNCALSMSDAVLPRISEILENHEFG